MTKGPLKILQQAPSCSRRGTGSFPPPMGVTSTWLHGCVKCYRQKRQFSCFLLFPDVGKGEKHLQRW